MCREAIVTAYNLLVIRTGFRSAFVESRLPAADAPELSEDCVRDLERAYRTLFEPHCDAVFEHLYREAMAALSTLPLDSSADVLNALTFVQDTVAIALWKYRCTWVADVLERFAREFDRLDQPSEQLRLHERAKTDGADVGRL